MEELIKVEPFKFNYKKVLPIGTFVSAEREILFGYSENDERFAYYSPKKIFGQIIGGRYKQLGIFHKGGGSSYDYFGEEDYEPNFLEVTSTIFLYEVRMGFINKIFLVHPNDIETNFLLPLNPKIPFKYVYMSEENRKSISKMSKDFPRDAKGRFTK